MVDYISFGNLNWQKFYLCSGHAKIREATAGSINTHFNKKGGVGEKENSFSRVLCPDFKEKFYSFTIQLAVS